MAQTKVIIDTDPGVDDVLAILLALTLPELEILAYVVTYGNTDVDASYTNIVKLYTILEQHFEAHPDDRARFPNYTQKPYIIRGPSCPLEGEVHSAQYFHGRDGLGNITSTHAHIATPHPNDVDKYFMKADKPASSLALDLIRENAPDSVTYIALGPLTNLALMMREDPVTCRQRLGRVVCMGGALDVPGNTTPVAEFNFFADPFAVHELLASGTGFPLDKFFLAPLDITTPHELPFPLYETHVDPVFGSPVPEANIQTNINPNAPSHAYLHSHLHSQPHDPTWSHPKPLHHFTSAFFERTRAVMLDYGKDAMELHDVVAVWCAAENPLGSPLREPWKVQRRTFQVERIGEYTRGMLVVDRRGGIEETTVGNNRSTSHSLYQDPAPVQVETEPDIHPSNVGVQCITQTPGPTALLHLILSRIWGVDVN